MRSGGAPGTRRLVLLALLLGCLGSALWWFGGRGPDGASDSRSPARVAAPADGELAGDALAGGRATSLLGAAPAAEAGRSAPVIPFGVRVPGDGRLEGRVVERAGGSPVPDARVDLLPVPPIALDFLQRVFTLAEVRPADPGRLDPVATTGTAADGSFAFSGVRAGHYFLEARAAYAIPDEVPEVLVSPSGAGGPVVIHMRPGGRVVGEVLLPDGRPAAGAEVSMGPGAGQLIAAMKSGESRGFRARTDDAGRFVLWGVPPGEGYEIAAFSREFAVSYLIGFAVRAGEDTQITIRARPGGRIAGRVTAVPLEGGDPRPVAGAHVGAIPRGLRQLYFAKEVLLATHAVTDAAGRYEMSHVPTGEADVAAWAPELLPGLVRAVRAADGVQSEAPDLELIAGPMVDGRVVDSAGTAIEGVEVRWELVDFADLEFDLTLAPLLTQAVEGFDWPLTDAEGRFRAGALGGDPPYRLTLYREGYALRVERWDPSRGTEIEIVLQRGGAVEGVVVDASTGDPVPAFTVETNDRIDLDGRSPSAWNPFSGGQVFETSDGRFHIDGIIPGDADLEFSARGYGAQRVRDLSVAEGEVQKGVIVKLEPGGRVSGRVVDGDGEPVAGARVYALDRDSGGEAQGPLREMLRDEPGAGALTFAAGSGVLSDSSTTADSEGLFELDGLAPGTVRLIAVQRDYATSPPREVLLESGGEEAGVEIVLGEGGGIYGNVTDRWDRPVAGALVVAASPGGMGGRGLGGGDAYSATTNARGDYAVEHMQGGGYFVAVVRADEELSIASVLGTLQFDLVSVPDDEPVRYDLVDRSAGGCRVSGVVSAGGVALTSGAVFATSFEGDNALGLEVKVARVGTDGRYEFPGLGPGAYQFAYQSRGPEARMDVEVPDAPEATIDLVLPDTRVAGTVLDAATHLPVRNAEVLLRSKRQAEPGGLLGALFAEESGARDYTAADGGFEFERVAEGSYVLVVRAPRWGEAQGKYAPLAPVDVVVDGKESVTGLELRLQPALLIEGIVRDQGGRAVEGASVVAIAVEQVGARPERGRTDGEGRFRIKGVGVGKYSVIARKDGFAEGQAEDVEAGAAEVLELVLVPGVEVRVHVRGADGEELAGAAARLLRGTGVDGDARRTVAGWLAGEGVSGADGWVEAGRYAAGVYRLEVVRGEEKVVVEGVEVEDGSGVAEFEVVLE